MICDHMSILRDSLADNECADCGRLPGEIIRTLTAERDHLINTLLEVKGLVFGLPRLIHEAGPANDTTELSATIDEILRHL